MEKTLKLNKYYKIKSVIFSGDRLFQVVEINKKEKYYKLVFPEMHTTYLGFEKILSVKEVNPTCFINKQIKYFLHKTKESIKYIETLADKINELTPSDLSTE